MTTPKGSKPQLTSTLRSRNLDGEGSGLIRPSDCEDNNEKPNPSPLKDIIGSIQKGFQKRNAFDSSISNPLNRKYETEAPRNFEQDSDTRSHKSSLSVTSKVSLRSNNLKNEQTDSVVYEVEVFPSEKIATKDIIKAC